MKTKAENQNSRDESIPRGLSHKYQANNERGIKPLKCSSDERRLSDDKSITSFFSIKVENLLWPIYSFI